MMAPPRSIHRQHDDSKHCATEAGQRPAHSTVCTTIITIYIDTTATTMLRSTKTTSTRKRPLHSVLCARRQGRGMLSLALARENRIILLALALFVVQTESDAGTETLGCCRNLANAMRQELLEVATAHVETSVLARRKVPPLAVFLVASALCRVVVLLDAKDPRDPVVDGKDTLLLAGIAHGIAVVGNVRVRGILVKQHTVARDAKALAHGLHQRNTFGGDGRRGHQLLRVEVAVRVPRVLQEAHAAVHRAFLALVPDECRVVDVERLHRADSSVNERAHV